MNGQHLHIISLDVPLPADYGGVIDIFYKIKALHALGIKIHLHCFSKGREPQEELMMYCEEVFYYKRRKFLQALPLRKPFMVASRNHPELLKNLLRDDHPILMEGIQSSYLLPFLLSEKRSVLLRLHNVEFLYYNGLATQETNIFKKIYFNQESRLLRRYEAGLPTELRILALSEADIDVYKNDLHKPHVSLVPAFTPWRTVHSKTGRGNYCLYHGNLSINENERAVEWLLDNVFQYLKLPFIVAGKHPSKRLRKRIKGFPNLSIVADPSDGAMLTLIQEAQVNVLPAFNATGVKLKILNALYNGRHCLINAAAVDSTSHLCTVATNEIDFRTEVARLFELDFTNEHMTERKESLSSNFNNERNARSIIDMIQ